MRRGSPLSLLCLLVAAVQLSSLVQAGRDYYEVLKLEKTATDKDIKRVRARLAAWLCCRPAAADGACQTLGVPQNGNFGPPRPQQG